MQIQHLEFYIILWYTTFDSKWKVRIQTYVMQFEEV